MFTKLKIVYIEDNPHHARIVYKVLTHAGFSVFGAETGLRGIEVSQRQQPDLILTDYNLPDIIGFEVVKRLRSLEAMHSIPIIMLTANNMPGDRQMALDIGCNAYLTKPIIRTELLNIIEYTIRQQAMS